jgi:hypothetical protein
MSGPGGAQFAVKLTNNPQQRRILFNEQVVGRLAAHLAMPCAAVSVVDISPEAAEGVLFASGQVGEPGAAHGSRWLGEVDNVDVGVAINLGNAARYTELMVLFTIVGNADPQYVHEKETPHQLYSVDHGHTFHGPDWTRETLEAQALPDEVMRQANHELDAATCASVRERLAAMTPANLARFVSCIPGSWRVSQADRIAAADYLWRRTAAAIELLNPPNGDA